MMLQLSDVQTVLLVAFLREEATRHERLVNHATRPWQSNEKKVAKKHKIKNTGLTQEITRTGNSQTYNINYNFFPSTALNVK